MKKFDFLITTSNSAYFSREEFEQLVKCINNIVKQLLDGGFSFAFRIFDIKLARNITNLNKSNNFLDENLSDLFAIVGGVITTRSSLIVEAINFELPVCEIIYRDTPEEPMAGWKVFYGLKMKKTFLSMKAKDEKRMTAQNHYINEFFEVSSIDSQEFSQLDINIRKLKVFLKKIMRI